MPRAGLFLLRSVEGIVPSVWKPGTRGRTCFAGPIELDLCSFLNCHDLSHHPRTDCKEPMAVGAPFNLRPCIFSPGQSPFLADQKRPVLDPPLRCGRHMSKKHEGGSGSPLSCHDGMASAGEKDSLAKSKDQSNGFYRLCHKTIRRFFLRCTQNIFHQLPHHNETCRFKTERSCS